MMKLIINIITFPFIWLFIVLLFPWICLTDKGLRKVFKNEIGIIEIIKDFKR